MKSQYGENDWKQFLKLCGRLKTEKQFNEFFDLFLTFEERSAIGNRCAVIRELLKGEKNQRDISSEFNVSIAKISRGSNCLKTIGKDLRKFLENNI